MNRKMLIFNFVCFMASVFIMAFVDPALAWVVSTTTLACNVIYETERIM